MTAEALLFTFILFPHNFCNWIDPVFQSFAWCELICRYSILRLIGYDFVFLGFVLNITLIGMININ